jgi:hypothetical protein
LVPRANTIAVLMNPNFKAAVIYLSEVEEAARSIGLQLHVLRASTESDFNNVFATLEQQKAGALLVAGDPFFLSRRDQSCAERNGNFHKDTFLRLSVCSSLIIASHGHPWVGSRAQY